jgi:alpha-beta hydrolase superfamily lysophospholipase
MGYENDTIWREMQDFLPPQNRLTAENMPEEYFLPLLNMNVHIDHYKAAEPKATLILFHGVGGNGRLLSFIAVRLAARGYEVICPDLPLYGHTEYRGKITYDTWVRCGCALVSHYKRPGTANIVLFGLSAGGMLAYQIADECGGIQGIIATCLLDQREVSVTKRTATNPLMAVTGKPFLAMTHKPLGKLKLPMKMITKMDKLSNNKDLVRLLLRDKRASGISLPMAFVHAMLNPSIKTEPEQFAACPVLLVHPVEDKWTDVSLSRIFYDKLSCDKELKMLDGAGHFPIEEKGLAQLEEYCLQFLEKTV